jgi:L-histidine N-alpha-methyltransferase
LLLDAFHRTGRRTGSSRVDVFEGTLREVAAALHAAYPGVVVEAVVADFTLNLARLPRGGRRTVAFLGGTVGNLDPTERARRDSAPTLARRR